MHSSDHRGPITRCFDTFLYVLGYILSWVMFHLVWRLRVIGRANIPRKGGTLFASNHASFADPPLVGVCIPRMMHFMAKQELFEIPLLGWYINRVQAFPLRRAERDVAAFRRAQKILDNGEALIVFPEGTRQKNGQLGRAKPGVGMLAVKTGCQVVPVYIHNSQRMKSLAKLTVAFSAPLVARPDEEYLAFSERVMAKISELKENVLGSRN